MKAFIAIVLLLAVAGLGAMYFLSATPSVRIDSGVKAIGTETQVKATVDSPKGVKTVTASIEQSGKRTQIWQGVQTGELTIPAGKKQAPELKDGPAKLIVEAKGAGWFGKTATATADVQVNTQPPLVSADGHQHYINQGGSELVTFNVSGYWTEAGVRVGNYTFRSFPIAGAKSENERFSLFAFPWDVPADTVPVVYARNPAGAEATARFWFKVFPKKFRTRDLPLSDQFMQKVTTELDPNGSGPLLDRFLKINREMRQANNAALRDLRTKTEPKLLWKGPFYRLGQVEAFFADRRSYMYNGKKVDEQMHLGFDLSDVQAAPVKASNSGRVVHAGPLGIYGNCVVIDHGYALQSIYGHMRRMDVKVGDMVNKEQVIGRSGETGLAGGDHLHYSMQVDGVQVQPIEWWDEHWIKDRVLSKLPAAQ